MTAARENVNVIRVAFSWVLLGGFFFGFHGRLISVQGSSAFFREVRETVILGGPFMVV